MGLTAVASSCRRLLIWTVLLQAINNGASETRQCFVCGDGSDEVFSTSQQWAAVAAASASTSNAKAALISTTVRPAPPSCQEFDQSTTLQPFARDCPEGFSGCLTEVRRTGVMRTCGTLALNDCKIANGIKYCYCKDDLCNREQLHFDEPLNEDMDDNMEDDDEDYGSEQYSGYGQDNQETNYESSSSSSSRGTSSGLPGTTSEKSTWPTTSKTNHQVRQLTTPPSTISAGYKVSINTAFLPAISLYLTVTLLRFL